MADETYSEEAIAGEKKGAETSPEAPAAETDAPSPKPARKPRRTKAEMLAAAQSDKQVKKTRVKRAPKEADVNNTSEGSDVAPTSAAPEANTSTPLDDIATLLQLEEENKALRKQLSEKLRAENADLRKRLGRN